MSSFRFVHAADIHIDSPLKGLAGHEGPAAERIRTATREAFDNLVGQAIDSEASFFIIAGDLYDGDWRDFQTGLFFIRQMGRLAEANIPVFLLHGNHDAESQITRRLDLPENVRVFSSRRPQTLKIEELGVALHGMSFRQRDVAENLVSAYPEALKGWFNIGVLHTGLGGLGGHANYAPCMIEDLINKGYDYWALGHVHKQQVIREKPRVVFPGCLQGRHIRETGEKGALFIQVEENEIHELGHLASDVVRWAVVLVDVEDCGTVPDVEDCVRSAIGEAIRRDAEGRLLACRVILKGKTGLHGRLIASSESLLAQARGAALGFGEEAAWVERLKIETEPVSDPGTIQETQDAIGDLRELLADACKDEDVRNLLDADIGLFIRKLHHEIKEDVEDAALAAAISGKYEDLIGEVTDYLVARISEESIG